MTVRYSVTASTVRFHRAVRGSIPRIGVFFGKNETLKLLVPKKRLWNHMPSLYVILLYNFILLLFWCKENKLIFYLSLPNFKFPLAHEDIHGKFGTIERLNS